ncbi:MAG TPA: fimbria/pilus outer membrane usher protein [Lysobacter sp.]|nr:fimbria/pilus outer membrane usher protein [Lysobacter sp.]
MRALKLRTLAAALAVALSLPVQAQEGDHSLLLDLCINGRCVGVAAVIERGADVLIDREALQIAGIEVGELASEHIGERDFISLKALNHGSTFTIDEAQLRLDLSLRAELLPGQHGDLQQRTHAELTTQPWSAFVNYAATMGQEDERALFVDGAFGRGNAALRSTADWNTYEGWRRGLTRFEVDQPNHLRRWIVGDQYAIASDPLGGGLLLGGFGIERAFDQDPYLVTFPQPFYSGVMQTPGTVEVYANGVLIGRQDLGAGPFTLDHLGIQPGRSDVKVVVRDPFGNRSELAAGSYYGSSSRMLARGLDEYAFRVGVPRDSSLGGSYDDRTTLQAWYRRGLSDAFTFGGRIEADDTLQNIGLDGVVRLPFGELALAVAASEADDVGRGSAVAATYNYASQHWSFGLGSRTADSAYRNLGDPFAAIAGRLRLDEYVHVGIAPPGRLSLQVNAGRQRRDGGEIERSMGMAGTLRLWPRSQLLFSLQRRNDALGRDTSALLSLNIALDRDNVGFSAHRHEDADGNSSSGYGLDARRSRPPGTGWGYDVSLKREEAFDSGFAQIEYQGTHGRYAMQAEHSEADDRARFIASGALVAIGGRVFATPPLESGFALVRVLGLADTPILRENLEVGHTDAQGDLLMRELLPFYANRVALDEAAVPADYVLTTPRRDVQVPRNTGALVTLEAAPVHALTGRLLRQSDTGLSPAGDRLWLARDGERVAIPLGQQGRFYLEDLPPGEHVVEVDGAAGHMQCRIEVPSATAPGVVDLGEILCAETSRDEAP